MESKPNYHFLWRKLHSLSGIIPLGVFLFVHLFINSFSLKGPDAFNEAAGLLVKLPYLIIIELVIIFIPLLYHMIYGLAITYSWDTNLASSSKLTNWTYFLQRLTGILAIIFIFAHVYGTTIQVRFIDDHEVSFEYMSLLLSRPAGFIPKVLTILISHSFHDGIQMETWPLLAISKNRYRIARCKASRIAVSCSSSC